MLEEDAGIIEIYKELEREMRSKRYTANLDSVDFTALDLLKPEVCWNSGIFGFVQNVQFYVLGDYFVTILLER